MGDRVLSTESAKTSIKKMQDIISGPLMDQVKSLDREGQNLSDRNVWDGPLASRFRDEIWPSTNTALDQALQKLEELRNQLSTINQNIMSAGGGS